MGRPWEIVWFERIYLGTLALGAVQSWIAWPALVKMGGPVFVVTTQLLTFALIGGLTLLISRRRSNIAKWILIGLFIAGLPIFIRHLLDGQLVGGGGSPVISITQLAAQFVALALLVTPASRNWFKREVPAEA
jgi:hypothetical protein